MPNKTHRPTKYELEGRLIEVQKLLDQNLNCTEIAQRMGLAKSTASRYVNTVFQRSKVKWDQVRSESLEDRALLIKNHYEDLAKECEQILHDHSKSPIARIEAGKTMIACQNNIYNMLKDGPLKLSKIETNSFEDKDD